MRKTERIEFRVTPEEKIKILNKCKEAEMNISGFLLESVDKCEIIVIPDLKKVVYELNKIGVNINQLTLKANQGAKCIGLEDVKGELKKIWQLLNSLIIKLD